MPPLPNPINHTVEAIYSAIAARARQGDNFGVPMGNAVNECDRAIWYALRWAAPPERMDGQKLRRFETGHREEARLLDDLAAAGVTVERVDPATGKQFAVALADGWLRGKIDARATGLPEAPKTEHVVECKSHNDRSFKGLLKHAPPKGEGLRRSKPEHFAQCQLYMHALKLHRVLYLAVNKNTDELYAERIEYDAEFALRVEVRVTRIAGTDRAPSRLHDDLNSKAAFTCQWCPALALCHERAFARVNCRTCMHAIFDSGAEVRCARTGASLSYDNQQTGCGQHRYLPDLVPAEQVDVAGDVVIYKFPDGQWWHDCDGKVTA